MIYAWSVLTAPPGSSASPIDPSAPKTEFSPDVAGDYTIRLQVTSGARSHQGSEASRLTRIDLGTSFQESLGDGQATGSHRAVEGAHLDGIRSGRAHNRNTGSAAVP